MKVFWGAILCILTVATTGGHLFAAADQPMIGESAPTFELPSLSGSTVDLKDYRGKTLVVHFGVGW